MIQVQITANGTVPLLKDKYHLDTNTWRNISFNVKGLTMCKTCAFQLFTQCCVSLIIVLNLNTFNCQNNNIVPSLIEFEMHLLCLENTHTNLNIKSDIRLLLLLNRITIKRFWGNVFFRQFYYTDLFEISLLSCDYVCAFKVDFFLMVQVRFYVIHDDTEKDQYLIFIALQ